MDILPSLASEIVPADKAESLSLLQVFVQNLRYRIESEVLLFTRSWPVTPATFKYLEDMGERGLRLWELNSNLNARLVRCFLPYPTLPYPTLPSVEGGRTALTCSLRASWRRLR